jgi:lipoprotein-releasing system ATP-binding protein
MILHAKGIVKKFGDLEVVKGVDLAIEAGEVVSIVGSSGAGKTTLLQVLGTLERPDSGSLHIDGVEPFALTGKALAAFRNTSIGFIFQFHQLLPEFTAYENAILPALIKGVSKQEAQQAAEELFDLLGIQARGLHKPAELSGGEQQRVAVARALINRPKLVFADEPSGNLDSNNATELHRLFFTLREHFKQTFVIVTHNTDLASMTDRTLQMRDGRMV